MNSQFNNGRCRARDDSNAVGDQDKDVFRGQRVVCVVQIWLIRIFDDGFRAVRRSRQEAKGCVGFIFVIVK